MQTLCRNYQQQLRILCHLRHLRIFRYLRDLRKLCKLRKLNVLSSLRLYENYGTPKKKVR
jgi:hypothetical protein